MSVTIHVGDALETLRALESESVQVCVTSPPYFQLRNYGVDGQIGLEATPAAFLDALYAVFDEVRRVLRDDGVCFVNLGDSYAGSGKGPTGGNGIGDQRRRQGFIPGNGGDQGGVRNRDGVGRIQGFRPKSLMLIPQRFAIGMADRGWIVRQEIVWAKKSAMPESVRDRCTSAWEPIFMFTKQSRYYWDADAVRQPNTTGTLERFGKNPKHSGTSAKTAQAGSGIKNNGSFREALQDGFVEGGANLRNVWHLGPEPSRDEHYAAFPTEIPRRCILAASRKGDTVLDPFLGSGTTLLVASRLERDGIGIELSPAYAEMARRRIYADAPMFADVEIA